MGAEQSSGRASGGQDHAVAQRKTCYYELLGLERTATEEEIRRAYKKKALELHPDRNINDVENSTRKFAEVQTAYEVLSDAQERAWYDSHRDAILSGDPDTDADTGDAPAGHYNMRITTTDEIYTLMGRFNSSVPLNDSPNGFFAILDVFFGQLAAEETAACEWEGLVPVEYPPFGSSTDDYDPVARTFYNAWAGFSTRKSFSWKDKYRLTDAPDRRIRRLMEKENRKFRDEGIRDFNDAVRSLVAFVKKRDTRYVPNTQSEAERQQVLRDSAAAQAARSRAANQENLAEYVLPQWATARNDEEPHNDEFSLSEEESEVEQIECVVCSKTFKSEKQFEAHEKSKKHIKAVQQLRRQMKKENKDLDLDLDLDEPSTKPTSVAGSESVHDGAQRDIGGSKSPSARDTAWKVKEKGDAVDSQSPTTKSETGKEGEEEDEEEEEGNSDYASRDEIMDRIAGASAKAGKDPPDPGHEDTMPGLKDLTLEESSGAKKVGKAKQKREKKAARQAAAPEQSTQCTLCGDSFSSRTKLFAHLNQDHPAPKGSKGTKKSKR